MSRRVGFTAEEEAAKFLMEQGFSIVERNFTAKMGEIDIVSLKDGVLHFVEVKYSKNYSPYERITPAKLSKLLRTIELYLQKKGLTHPYQLDALFIEDKTFNLVENISF